MAARTTTLEALQEQSLEAFLRYVAEHHVSIIVRLPDGKEVLIEPQPWLQPLPVLNHTTAQWHV